MIAKPDMIIKKGATNLVTYEEAVELLEEFKEDKYNKLCQYISEKIRKYARDGGDCIYIGDETLVNYNHLVDDDLSWSGLVERLKDTFAGFNIELDETDSSIKIDW